MITPTVSIYQKRHRRKRVTSAGAGPVPPPPPPPPLACVAGTYNPGNSIDLTFNQDVDIAGVEVGAFFVDDGDFTEARFAGTGVATLTSPTTVRIMLEEVEPDSSPGVHLTVNSANGIAASEGGEMWAGIADQELPFGE